MFSESRLKVEKGCRIESEGDVTMEDVGRKVYSKEYG
jgi:hypothetical protein